MNDILIILAAIVFALLICWLAPDGDWIGQKQFND